MSTLKGVFPKLEISKDDIVFTFCGVRPLPSSGMDYTSRVSRSHRIEDSAPDENHTFPIYSLIGGKLTTFGVFAEETADKVLGQLGKYIEASNLMHFDVLEDNTSCIQVHLANILDVDEIIMNTQVLSYTHIDGIIEIDLAGTYNTGDFLEMTFPVDKVPYVGIWINEGGFFEGKGSFNVALEPCTGCPDKLETAIQRGEHALIKGASKNTWCMDITIEQT